MYFPETPRVSNIPMNSIERSYSLYLQRELKKYPIVSVLDFEGDEEEISRKCEEKRRRLKENIFGFPEPFPVKGIVVGSLERKEYRIEKIVLQCEAASWLTAHLYLPASTPEQSPAIVLACGHGGSKSHGYNQIAAQLYAQAGCAVLLPDPIGEEERNSPYGLGLRGHRAEYILDRLNQWGRPFLGKVVYDLQCCVDYLLQRAEICPDRIGCAGSSMGGTCAQLFLAIDTRIQAGIVSSWAADFHEFDGSNGCCYRLPALIQEANQVDLLALAAPNCRLLVCSGVQDEITPPLGLERMGKLLKAWWERRGSPGFFDCHLGPTDGHRPFHMTALGLKWMSTHLNFGAHIDWENIATISIGDIATRCGRKIEPLYATERHHQGTLVPANPLTFETPEDLRVLTDGVLKENRLHEREFTIQGYLTQLGVATLERIPALPEGNSTHPPEARRRVTQALKQLIKQEPDWFHAPHPEMPVSLGVSDAGTSYQDWELGFAGCLMRVHTCFPHEAPDPPFLVFGKERHRLAFRPEPSMCLSAVFDFVTLNDNEMLLGYPSLLVNLFLARRGINILRRHFGFTKAHLHSEIPRLGELLLSQEPQIQTFRLDADCAVETSGLPGCQGGRAENVLPGCWKYLHWIDLFLSRVDDCHMELTKSYFCGNAAKQVQAASNGGNVRWKGEDNPLEKSEGPAVARPSKEILQKIS